MCVLGVGVVNETKRGGGGEGENSNLRIIVHVIICYLKL